MKGYRSRQHKKGGKGARWKKGQSSSSNPAVNVHRKQTKANFFQPLQSEQTNATNAAKLTPENLAKLNISETDKTMDYDETVNSIESFVSNWSQCTHNLFGRLINQNLTGVSHLHNEMLAVVSAIADTVEQSETGADSPTTYFAALISLAQKPDSDTSLTATMYLLSLAMRAVPKSVLVKTCPDVSKMLVDILGAHSSSSDAVLLRSTIRCLGFLLQAQPLSFWSDSVSKQIFDCLLVFAVNSKAKVRKAAHSAVSSTVSHSLDNPHPSVPWVVEFCKSQIDKLGGKATGTIYALTTLKLTFKNLHLSTIKSICEMILQLLSLSAPAVRFIVLQTFKALFDNAPSSMSAEVNARVLTALHDYKPNVTDVDMMSEWLDMMESGLGLLGCLDDKLAYGHLSKFVSVCVSCFQSDRKEVAVLASKNLQSVMTRLLVPMETDEWRKCCEVTTECLQRALGFQFHEAWPEVLCSMKSLVTVAGSQGCDITKGCLLAAVALYETRDDLSFPVEFDNLVCACVQTWGPKVFLSVVPLKSGSGNFNRGWILPLLERSIEGPGIAFFAEFFLPLTRNLARLIESSANTVESQPLRTYEKQIWSLFPKFAIQAADVEQIFPNIAREVGTALNSRPGVQLEAMRGLRRLILDSTDDGKTTLSRFSKNFVPILFNLFTSTESNKENDDIRLAALETIRVYIKISEQAFCHEMFDNAYAKFGNEESSSRIIAILELLITLSAKVDVSRRRMLFKFACENLDNTDKTIQKKCYQLFAHVCSESMVMKDPLDTEKVKNTLSRSMSTCKPSAKVSRLKCWSLLLTPEAKPDLIGAIIPEVVLATKAVGTNTRNSAFALLGKIGSWFERNISLDEFFKLFLSGRACEFESDPTIGAIAHCVSLFGSSLDAKTRCDIVDHMTQLLDSKERDVIRETIKLFRICLKHLNLEDIGTRLDVIITALLRARSNGNKMQVRHAFVRLVRKFGVDAIRKLVSSDYRKVIANIHKVEERKLRAKQETATVNDEEDYLPTSANKESIDDLLRDSDMEDEDETQDSSRPKGSTVWLQEGQNIVDFLDPSAVQSIHSSLPTKTSVTASQDEFKTDSEGKLIIGESEKKAEDEQTSLDVDLEAAFAQAAKNKKSRKRPLELSDDDDEDDKPVYQAGGSGIHRALSKKSRVAGSTTSGGTSRTLKSKKSAGDVKKGKYEPYAYVPLEVESLNKRKRKKFKGQFSHLIRKGRKGAIKGTRLKNKGHKNN